MEKKLEEPRRFENNIQAMQSKLPQHQCLPLAELVKLPSYQVNIHAAFDDSVEIRA